MKEREKEREREREREMMGSVASIVVQMHT